MKNFPLIFFFMNQHRYSIFLLISGHFLSLFCSWFSGLIRMRGLLRVDGEFSGILMEIQLVYYQIKRYNIDVKRYKK